MPAASAAAAITDDRNKVDIYCVGQAVTTYRHPTLLEDLHHAPNQTLAESHIWVANAGGSSITFGSAVTLGDKTLATCSRVFLRIDTSTRRPIKITNEERSTLYAVDEDGDGKLRFGVPIPKVRQINFSGNGTNTATSGVSDVDRTAIAGEEVLAVTVGPQHINHSDHVDHTFLADTAYHALYLSTPPGDEAQESTTLGVHYLAPGRLGQELRCHKHKTDDGAFVSMWGDDGAGGWKLLVLANQLFEPLPV